MKPGDSIFYFHKGESRSGVIQSINHSIRAIKVKSDAGSIDFISFNDVFEY